MRANKASQDNGFETIHAIFDGVDIYENMLAEIRVLHQGLLLIVSSNLAMPDYTWIPSALTDITPV